MYGATDIIEGALAAAVDGQQWPAWLHRTQRQLGSNGGFVGVLDLKAGVPTHFYLTADDPRVTEEYGSWSGQIDPQLPIVAGTRTTRIYTDRDHLDWRNPTTAEYMKWQIDRTAWFSHLTVATRLSEDFHCGFSLHFPRDDAGRALQLQSKIGSLAKSIALAMRMGFVHNEKLHEAYWRGAASARDRLAVLLLDETGAVMRLNPRAEQLVAGGASLSCRFGRLYCRRQGEDARLQAHIAGAVPRLQARPAALRIGEPPDELIVQILPVVWRTRLLSPFEPAALVLVHQLGSRMKSDAQIWRELFDLTPAEAKVAERLKIGASALAISDELAITVQTARQHIKAIHEKTETRRNAELAHLLTRLSRE